MSSKYPESGEAIRSARKQRRPPISQERLADAIGISRRHMIRLENGEHRPSLELRERLALILDVDASSLPTEEQAPSPFCDAA